MHTQALTENCTVCRSQRKGVELGVDAPVVLVVDPTRFNCIKSQGIEELRCITLILVRI